MDITRKMIYSLALATGVGHKLLLSLVAGNLKPREGLYNLTQDWTMEA
jgi:ABC-type thiamine transport system ATPase subunit